jgi:hypothetical protein
LWFFGGSSVAASRLGICPEVIPFVNLRPIAGEKGLDVMSSPKKIVRTLAELESDVLCGWEATLVAAEALHTIWADEMYKASHERFDDYVKEKFGKSVQWSYDLLGWWKIIKIAGCEKNPMSMNSTRPLKSLSDDPKVVKNILIEAMKIAKTKTLSNVTRRDVKEAKAKVLGKPKTKAKATKPLPTVVSVVGLLKAVDKSLRLKSAKKLTVKQTTALQTQMDKLEVLVKSIKEALASGGVEVGGTSK